MVQSQAPKQLRKKKCSWNLEMVVALAIIPTGMTRITIMVRSRRWTFSSAIRRTKRGSWPHCNKWCRIKNLLEGSKLLLCWGEGIHRGYLFRSSQRQRSLTAEGCRKIQARELIQDRYPKRNLMLKKKNKMRCNNKGRRKSRSQSSDKSAQKGMIGPTNSNSVQGEEALIRHSGFISVLRKIINLGDLSKGSLRASDSQGSAGRSALQRYGIKAFSIESSSRI